MSTVAKLFMSGRSQAICWPAKLRLNASKKQVYSLTGLDNYLPLHLVFPLE